MNSEPWLGPSFDTSWADSHGWLQTVLDLTNAESKNLLHGGHHINSILTFSKYFGLWNLSGLKKYYWILTKELRTAYTNGYIQTERQGNLPNIQWKQKQYQTMEFKIRPHRYQSISQHTNGIPYWIFYKKHGMMLFFFQHHEFVFFKPILDPSFCNWSTHPSLL
jgi:hypothetical protein